MDKKTPINIWFIYEKKQVLHKKEKENDANIKSAMVIRPVSHCLQQH